ncbi:MAG: lysophospholipase [Acetobacteraceae bacterium]|nr:lysophospholipase [Acetobacteraceae bacterium]
MIQSRPVVSIVSRFLFAACCALLALLPGCALPPSQVAPALVGSAAAQAQEAFIMPDGVRLPYRKWLPRGDPWAVVLALHGMNDSRDAWEIPAPMLSQAGVAVFAPDQRGFGATATRGYWPGAAAMVSDAAVLARVLRARYPHAKLILMGESMGGAVLLCLAASPLSGLADGYVLVAPAVWGRAEQNLFLRATLWFAYNAMPGLELGGAPGLKITASDNREALIRLARDPLTLHRTRVDAVEGLVDLMDLALASAPLVQAPTLVLYGGKDELVPDHATAAAWRALPSQVHLGYYSQGYHLLLRDKDRAQRLRDVIGWIADPSAPLPSGADRAAAVWMEQWK